MKKKGVTKPRPIWIKWRDHCQQEGHTHLKTNPCSGTFVGYTNLLGETEEDYIVCQFYGDVDGAWFDRLAIMKVAVIEIRYLDEERL